MSALRFQLYMNWFRVLAVFRTLTRAADRHVRKNLPGGLAGLRWLRAVWLTPLWLSFELAITLWEYFEAHSGGKWHLRTWQRALWWLALALAMDLGLVVFGAHVPVSEGLLLLCAGHGVILFVTWKRGARWFRRMLGVRPVRPSKGTNPYEGLDLGN